MKKKLEIKWVSPRIVFNFCLCPLCKTWIEFAIDSPFKDIMMENLKLFEEIKSKSLARLKFEEREKDPKLVDPKGAYFNK
jgi:hypothetical protein